MERRDIMKVAMKGSLLAAATGAGALSSQVHSAGTDKVLSSARTGLKKGYLDGPFGQIHYYESGDVNSPCLILAHQSPSSARMFEKAMPLMAAQGLRAIAVDTPGFGNSDVPPAPPSIADYATILPCVLDGLGLDSAHFLGHHTGAAIMCSFASKHPKLVKSLILHGPPLFSEEDLEPFKDIKPEPHPIYKDGSHLQKAWDRRVKYTPGWTDEIAMHRRLVDQLWAGDTSWYGHNAAFKYAMTDDYMALTTVTMILNNSGDDANEMSLKAKRMRPDFTYKELKGGTHDIVDERPVAWSNAVAEFVLGQP